MKKLAMLILIVLTVCLAAPAAFAQEGGAAKSGNTNWVAITSGFAMAVAAAFCGLAQSRVGSAACEGMARNPGAADAIRGSMILGLVFIETLALFTLLVVFTQVK